MSRAPGGASRRGAFLSLPHCTSSATDTLSPFANRRSTLNVGSCRAELDPRQVPAAHVGFPGEGFLAQTMGRPQLAEPLHQGVHMRPQCYLSCTARQPDNRGLPWPTVANPSGHCAAPLPDVGSLTRWHERAVGVGVDSV